MTKLVARPLTREEIPLAWTIDRREFIANIYRLQDGELVLEPHNFDVPGWPPGNREGTEPLLYDCFDRGGFFRGVFDGTQLAGLAVLDPKPLGQGHDQRQLKFLHVGRPYRRLGVGEQLFVWAKEVAKGLGARSLYVSATQSENTINFYRRMGCFVTATPDAELFTLEPEDIHLECAI